MNGKKKEHTHTIPRSSGLKKLARGIARRTRSMIKLQAVHPPIWQKVIAVVTSDIHQEMTKLCAKQTHF